MKRPSFVYYILLFVASVASGSVHAGFDTSVMTNVLHNMAVKQAMKSQQKQRQQQDQSNNLTATSPAGINRQGGQIKALIVTGEGMYPASNNPAQSQAYPQILETVAGSLKDHIVSSGQSADVYMRTQNDPNIREFVPRILEHKLHNSLIQVAMSRENNGDIYIVPTFNPLAFQTNDVQILQGIEGKYQIYSAANPNAPMPTFQQVAERFILDLKKNGYVKN
ncbi:hypothetical protein ACH518_06815 [Methylomonas sp. HW2-6]|uniref:hypothetical protein n=1 Tax=Methylomonas sp. HW2-6 TaxID=3376687 RepID=UPI00404357D3